MVTNSGSLISQTGDRQPLSSREKPIISQHFCQKTAWKWKKLDQEGEARVPSTSLGSANGYVTTQLGHSKQIFFVHQQWSNLFRFFFHFQWRIHAHPWESDSGTPGGSANDFPCLFNITAKMSSDNIPLTLINSLSCFHLLSSINCVFLPFDQWNFSLAYVPV